jgi:putative ABC transport system substrate-binding protein
MADGETRSVVHFAGLVTGMENAIRSLISEIDLLVAWGTIGAVAAKNVAGSLPVVFLNVGAPVEVGLVQS